MTNATESPLRTIPGPRARRVLLAKNLREARLLRHLLRLSQAADAAQRESSQVPAHAE
jgi:hypothetical protein